MSANNFLAIVLGPDGFYRAYDRYIDEIGCCCTVGPNTYVDECGHGVEQPVFKVGTLQDAIEEAERYVLNNAVEYNYRFLNLAEDGKEETQSNMVEEENLE